MQSVFIQQPTRNSLHVCICCGYYSLQVVSTFGNRVCKNFETSKLCNVELVDQSGRSVTNSGHKLRRPTHACYNEFEVGKFHLRFQSLCTRYVSENHLYIYLREIACLYIRCGWETDRPAHYTQGSSLLEVVWEISWEEVHMRYLAGIHMVRAFVLAGIPKLNAIAAL